MNTQNHRNSIHLYPRVSTSFVRHCVVIHYCIIQQCVDVQYTCMWVVWSGSSNPLAGWREIHGGRGDTSMKKVPERLPMFEREREVEWIWRSVTRAPTSTTSLDRLSLGDGARLSERMRNKRRESLTCIHIRLYWYVHSACLTKSTLTWWILHGVNLLYMHIQYIHTYHGTNKRRELLIGKTPPSQCIHTANA